MQAGLLKIRDKRVVFADTTAQEMFPALKPLDGRPLTDIFPEYRPPENPDTARYRRVTADQTTYFLHEILLSAPLDLLLITIMDADPSPLSAAAPDVSKGGYRKLDPIIESLHDDIVISDGKGVVQHVSPAFLDLYGVTEAEVLGKSVFDLEAAGVFAPSAAAMVLEKREKVTFVQKTGKGDHLVITGVPVLNRDNEITQVISYSHDLKEFLKLKKRYEELEDRMRVLATEVRALREREMLLPEIVAQSPLMDNIIKLAVKVAEVDINLIIVGESGVGKNLIARFIHQHSPRREGAFIEINCGAIPESLLESELFGYEPGAFTGASKEGKIGRIELARNGTLFLDEIGDLPLDLQVKLLKVLQEKSFTKVGGTRSITVDFRLISATNRDLETRVKERKFREDLYYRLNVVPIIIPPLRERREDALMLIDHFLNDANRRFNKQKRLSSRVIETLVNHDWPGNVRELQNLIHRLVITSENQAVQMTDLPAHCCIGPSVRTAEGMTLRAAKEAIEKNLVIHAYRRHKTTVGVGRALGISQASAARKVKKYRTDMQK